MKWSEQTIDGVAEVIAANRTYNYDYIAAQILSAIEQSAEVKALIEAARTVVLSGRHHNPYMQPHIALLAEALAPFTKETV